MNLRLPAQRGATFVFRSVIDKNFLGVGGSVVEASDAGGFLQQANVLTGVFAKLLS